MSAHRGEGGDPTETFDPDPQPTGSAEAPARRLAETTDLAAIAASLPGRFELVRLLGRGGMGEVFEVVDRTLGRTVALKRLAPERRDAEHRVRFVREARAAAMLHHPNIVTIHDVDTEGEYLVMELVDGESLAERLRRERVALPEARRIASALVGALAAAHGAGIVHRDVKPANLLLDRHGGVKLADFGVATFADSELTSTGVRVGTPAYMAPEQLRGRATEPGVDVYAAGATMFQLFTGQPLHVDGERATDVAGAVHAATGDRRLARTVARAVAERAADRFSDAIALQAALVPPVRRTGTVVLAAILVTALVAGLALAQRRSVASAGGRQEPLGARRIAFVPFADRTGDPSLDYSAHGLPHVLASEMLRVEGITVIEASRIRARLASPDASPVAWREAAHALGADAVVSGALHAVGGELEVEVQALDRRGHQVFTHRARVSRDAVSAEMRALAPALVERLTGARAVVQPSPAEASQRAMIEGAAALERHELAAATASLSHAVELDARNQEARYYLAIALWWSGGAPGEVKGQLDRIDRSGLAPTRRAFVDGLELFLDADYAAAVEHFAREATRYPEDREILYGWFEALFHAGQPRAAMAVHDRLRGHYPQLLTGIIHVLEYRLLHAPPAELADLLDGIDVSQGRVLESWEGLVAIARRDYDAALASFEARFDAGRTDSGYYYVIDGAVAAYALRGQLEFAREISAVLPQESIEHRWMLAAAQGEPVALRAADDAVRQAAAVAVPGLERSVRVGMLAAVALVSERDPRELRSILDQVREATHPSRREGLVVSALRVLLACRVGDVDELERSLASPVATIAAAAGACAAERRGDLAAAVAGWRRAFDGESDAGIAFLELVEIARLERAQGDVTAAAATCGGIVQPRRMVSAWGGAVGRCRMWRLEAALIAGDRAGARAERDALARLRRPDDPLVKAADARLAVLP